MKPTLKRIVTAVGVFAILVFYLYGLQLAYETKNVGPLTKAVLFAALIFGGSLSWDITKHIFRLPEPRLSRFIAEMRNTICFMSAYVASFVSFFLLLGPWAGPQTTIVLVVGLVSIAACFKAIISLGAAIDAAAKEGVA